MHLNGDLSYQPGASVNSHFGLSAATQPTVGAVVTLDAGGRITGATDHVEQFFGLDSHQLRGRSIREFLPALALGAATPGYNLAYVQFWFPDGRWRWVQALHADGASQPVHISARTTGRPGQRDIVVLLRKVADEKGLA